MAGLSILKHTYDICDEALCERRVTPAIKRQMRWHAAVEAVIGHFKAEHRMGRNHAHATGDATNAVLAAAGYNFRLLIRWLKLLCGS
jgi:IS5 family transposase